MRKGRVLPAALPRHLTGSARRVERGLLSIAFDPGYARNRRLYAYFTDTDGDIRVAQMRRSPKSNLRAKREASTAG